MWSDLSSLDSIYRNCIFSPRGIGETNSITTKKAIQTNLNLALDVALKTTNQHAQFFNTLFQFADDDCKESLKLIQKRHRSMLHDKFTGIEQYTRDLTTQERASINSPGDFTIDLFKKSLQQESALLTNDPKAILYLLGLVSFKRFTIF